MLEGLGFKVLRLKRVEYARIGLDGLKPGEWRYLTPEEVETAKKLASPKPVVIHRSPEEKSKKKKGKKKRKKETMLKKRQEEGGIVPQEQPSGSEVLESITKELDVISGKIEEEKEEN
jgi:hypothetical protein